MGRIPDHIPGRRQSAAHDGLRDEEPTHRLAYSPAEAAELLGVDRKTVYRLIWAGELPAEKIGGLLYISAARLRERLGELGA